MKITNQKLSIKLLEKKTSKVYGEAKWIKFSKELMSRGFEVYLYEARRTFSKYLTVKKGNSVYKVRFSNHKPIKEREEHQDCDFFVGVTNFKVTTTEDALEAVYKFFKRKEYNMEKLDVDLKELTEKMDELKDYKAKLDLEVKQTKKAIEEIEMKLANVLEKTGVESMVYGVYSFGWKTTTSRRFDQNAFGQLYPDLLEKFKLPSESKKFEFKINK